MRPLPPELANMPPSRKVRSLIGTQSSPLKMHLFFLIRLQIWCFFCPRPSIVQRITGVLTLFILSRFFFSSLEKISRIFVCTRIRMNCKYRFAKAESAAPGFEALRITRIRVNPHLLESHFVRIRSKICWISESSESRIRWSWIQDSRDSGFC